MIPCVCVCVVQGLCTSLMEFAWKSHISLLFPSPAQFTAFLGDVSMWQGVVTGALMVRVRVRVCHVCVSCVVLSVCMHPM